MARALVAAAALLSAGIGDAVAQCAPSAATVSAFQTVTCTGTETSGYNLPTSYTATNLTITIESGAMVTGTDPLGTFSLATGNTVINNGTIVDNAGTFPGLSAAIGSGFGTALIDSDVIINNGTIIGVLDGINIGTGNGQGVETVTNNGTIQAGAAGIRIFGNSNGLVTNNGRITASGTGAGGILDAGVLVATNRGTILVSGTSAIGMAGLGNGSRLENSGTIEASGTSAVAVGLGGTGSTFTNTGRITATGTNAAAVFLVGNNQALALGTGSTIQGPVRAIGSAAAIQLTGDGAFPTDVAGFSTLTMAGPGTWTLPAAVSFNSTSVNGGVLAVNGTLTSPVTVNALGTLGGTGTIVGTVVNGGRVAPGNSIGVLTINGNYTQGAGGTLAVEISPTGSDRLVIGGAANLAGTVLFLPQAAYFNEGLNFTYLTAGSITGGFSTVSGADVSAFLGLTQSSAGGQLGATLVRTRSYAAAAATDNQRAASGALDRVRIGAAEPLAGDLFVLDNTPTIASAQAAFDSLSGEGHASFVNVALDAQQGGQRALADRLSERRGFAAGASTQAAQLASAAEPSLQVAALPGPDSDRGGQAWARLLGGVGSGEESGKGGYEYIAAGAMVGADYRIARDWIVGGAIAYVRSEADVDARATDASIDSYSAAVYGGWSSGAWFADGSAAVNLHRFDVRRGVTVGSLGGAIERNAESDYDGLGAGVYAAAGYRAVLGTVEVTPEIRLSYNRLHRDGFSEDGAGALGLAVDSDTIDSVRSGIGVTVSRSFAAGEQGIAFTPWARAFWQHEFADRDRLLAARFSGAAGSSFQVTGVEPGRDSALVGAGLIVGQAQTLRGFFTYDGEFSGDTSAHSVSAGIRIAF